MESVTTDGLLEGLEALKAVDCRIQRQMLRLIAELDDREVAEDQGAYCTAHLVSMWLGISGWKADRWVNAAQALEQLPKISE
ncbi:MAG TPA: DUF222 domain-containing protein, partial [Actinomycetota bacterium]